MNVKEPKNFFNGLSENYDNIELQKLFKSEKELISDEITRFYIGEAKGKHKKGEVTEDTFICAISC